MACFGILYLYPFSVRVLHGNKPHVKNIHADLQIAISPPENSVSGCARGEGRGGRVLWVFDEEPRDEVFGQDAGVAEELIVKGVVNG